MIGANLRKGFSLASRSLNEITDLQRKKVEALTGEYKRIVAEKGENSKAAQDLQIRINKETESLNKNESELRKNASTLESVGNEAKTRSRSS